MAAPIVALADVGKDFAGVRALHGVDLSIEPGEICCLCGENGSGKSTLIKIIAGVHAPTTGTVALDGETRDSLSPTDSLRAGVRVIYQDFSLFPNLTVAENIAFTREVAGRIGFVSRARQRAAAQEALGRMNVDVDVDRLAGDLNMVDRQLVAIASALASEARLIIMDEPTTALSQREVAALLDVVKSLKADGVSTLFVSHKLDEVAEISDRTVVLRNGEKTADRPAAEFDREALVAAMTGRTVEYGTLSVGPVAADAPVVLDVASLGRADSFDGVNLTLRAGEVLGITGLLGSGRNDLALSLFGLLPADTGTVAVDGRRVQLRSVQDALDAGIGLVPEDRLTEGLFLDHSIGDNIVIRTIDKLTGALGFTSPTKMKDAAWRWVDELSVKTPTISQPVSTLSGGNQQRVVLAKWLSAEPRVLILCGPTVGVDIGSKRQILDLLGTLAAAGMAIIVISDDVPELLDVCHSIALMSEGRIEQRFDRAAITEAELNTLLMSA